MRGCALLRRLSGAPPGTTSKRDRPRSACSAAGRFERGPSRPRALSAPWSRPHGVQVTQMPFVRLNVEIVQNDAALRYQHW